MQSYGYSVLRFWNTDVLKHREAVCETILAALTGRLTESTDAFDLRYRPQSLAKPHLPRSSGPLVSGSVRCINLNRSIQIGT